jgi:cytochrome P450
VPQAGYSGIDASFQPVDWSVSVSTAEPDEITASIMDPNRRGDLYPLYRQLRECAPVHHCPPDLFNGVWLLTRYSDVKKLLSSKAAVGDPSVVDTAFNHGDGTFSGVMRNIMTFLDSDSHKRVRSLAATSFTPRAIARFRPIAERVANDLCDKVQDDGGMDLVSQYNYELPFNVIARVLGVPEDDFPLLKGLAWDFARAGEPLVNDEVARRGDDATRDLISYFEDLIAKRRSERADDLVSSLVAVEDGGDRLSPTELVCNCILLMQAGHETTQDLLGNAMVALARNPDQLSLLRGRPDTTKDAVEEFLRYDGSVQLSQRLLLTDMTFDDIIIPAGSVVCAFLGAANRDPEQFRQPDRLDIERNPNPHLAFAFGAYYCLGQTLARTEVFVGIRTLLDRFPGIRPARDTFQWRDTLHLHGPARLDVAW